MKQIILTLFFLLIYSINYGQTPAQESKASKGVPVIFVDSIRISQADMQKYKPDDIATITVYKDSMAYRHLDSNAIGVVYIETKQFSKKRFLNYFNSKSSEFKHLLMSEQSDDNFLYILNGKVLGKGYEGKLTAINDKNFKSITVINKKELANKYGNTEKNFGILIVADVPENAPKRKE
ncbi:hypothetical protein [Sphingobacterium sp. WOUb80]|uniref:hypothetical protein n=1 Tax=Sphingobacterium sp. WOUb80 TaxID=3234028 RepID=UPI003CF79E13